MGRTVVIPGPPQAKERPRFGANSNVYSPSRKAEEQIAGLFFGRYRGLYEEGPVALVCQFHCSSERADGDNLVKLVADSMQLAGVVRNDRQVKFWVVDMREVDDREDEKTVVWFGRREELRGEEWL